jgi:ABC-type uncharacterized transport system involved in gliding motility auxiliary subunit
MFDRIQHANRTTLAIAGAVLAVVLFLCVTLIVSLTPNLARIDLSEDQISTVSPSTKLVLSSVTAPLLLRF